MSNPGASQDGAPSLTIGAVAKRSGKSASAIRYYEQIGLLPEPARAAGRRRYDEATVRTLAVIETAQRAGLALDEIKVLLDVFNQQLAEFRDWLECAARCECPDLDQCPLFDEPALLPAPAKAPTPAQAPAPVTGSAPAKPSARAG